MSQSPSIHANCVVCGERGVLIFGPSGAGKSGFSSALMSRARSGGAFARLVADDRVLLVALHGRLIARPHPVLAGLMERRGLGIIGEPHLTAAVVGLVVELGDHGDRLPEPESLTRTVEGVSMPAIALDPKDPEAAGHALKRLELAHAVSNCDRFALAFAPQHEKIARSAS